MKTLKSILLFVAILFLAASQSMGQSKTELSEKKIKSQTVLEVFIEEGSDEPQIEQKEIYNEDGELIEFVTYNKEGDVKDWVKYVYDENQNIVEEIYFDKRGKVEKREKTIYKDGIRVERQFFDSRDRMYKKKIYEYEYRK
jgi:hypothetical protein